MNMTPKRTVLLLATAVPGVYILWFVFAAAVVPFEQMVRIHVGVMVLMLVLTVAYVVDVFRNRAVPHEKRALWAVVLVLGGFVAQLIYFFIYVRPQPDVPTSVDPI